MASAQVVETSVTNNSPSQDSNHPDDLFQSRYVTPGFKPFSYLGTFKLGKCSFVSVNYSNLEEPWNWEENPYLKDAKYMIMGFTSSQVRTTLILLYHKLLKKCKTFNPIFCKSKKKTNLFCFLTTFFKTARFEHENEMQRKALKHTQKKLESSPFGNPESTELESGIQDSPGLPYMGRVAVCCLP